MPRLRNLNLLALLYLVCEGDGQHLPGLRSMHVDEVRDAVRQHPRLPGDGEQTCEVGQGREKRGGEEGAADWRQRQLADRPCMPSFISAHSASYPALDSSSNPAAHSAARDDQPTHDSTHLAAAGPRDHAHGAQRGRHRRQLLLAQLPQVCQVALLRSLLLGLGGALGWRHGSCGRAGGSGAACRRLPPPISCWPTWRCCCRHAHPCLPL